MVYAAEAELARIRALRTIDAAKHRREIETGLRGFENWLDFIQRYSPEGQYWDPDNRLRSEIQTMLAMIGGRDTNLSQLVASGEWLGKEFEEEIDLAEQDRIDDLLDNNGGDGKE